MHSFKIPQTFGDRPCDRILIAKLKAFQITDLSALGMMLRVWRDFASGRSDRRTVPASAQDRACATETLIIESFAGWSGDAGRFLETAIESGFFTLVDEGPGTVLLVLADFYPANSSADELGMSASRIGGLRKGVNHASKVAAAAAGEQMEMFRAQSSPLLSEIGEKPMKEAMLFVHQLCNVLRRKAPPPEFWQRELARKAHEVRNSHTGPDRDRAFAWLSAHRADPSIPPAIDLVLDRFHVYVKSGRNLFVK